MGANREYFGDRCIGRIAFQAHLVGIFWNSPCMSSDLPSAGTVLARSYLSSSALRNSFSADGSRRDRDTHAQHITRLGLIRIFYERVLQLDDRRFVIVLLAIVVTLAIRLCGSLDRLQPARAAAPSTASDRTAA